MWPYWEGERTQETEEEYEKRKSPGLSYKPNPMEDETFDQKPLDVPPHQNRQHMPGYMADEDPLWPWDDPQRGADHEGHKINSMIQTGSSHKDNPVFALR